MSTRPAVNDSGEVAGTASFGAGNPDDTRRTLRWQAGTGFANLGAVGPVPFACISGCISSGGVDLNNSGVVVGG